MTVEGGRRFLVRHGQDLSGARGEANGLQNHPLTKLGKRQAERAGETLKPHNIHVVISSTLERAFQTARIIAIKTGAWELLDDPGLCEMDYGMLSDWQKGEIIRFADAHPEYVLQTDHGNKTVPFLIGVPGMEHPQNVYERVSRTLEWSQDTFPNENIAYVGHAISLCLLYGVYHHLSWEDALRKFHIQNGGIRELTSNNQ